MIASHSQSRNCKHVYHRRIVDARLADHAGPQNVVGIGNRNLCGESARNGIRKVADGLHLAVELPLLKRRNGNEGARAFMNHANLRFGDSDAHLYWIEVQHGEDRISGRDGVANIYMTCADESADWSPQLTIAQMFLRFVG